MLAPKTKLHDALHAPLKLPRWPRKQLASTPNDTAEIPLLMALDLHDSLIPEAQHRRVLELCNQVGTGVCLIVISPEPWCADAQIHPDTLDIAVQYSGIMLHDPQWRTYQWQALLLPGEVGLQLALLHCLQHLNEAIWPGCCKWPPHLAGRRVGQRAESESHPRTPEHVSLTSAWSTGTTAQLTSLV